MMSGTHNNIIEVFHLQTAGAGNGETLMVKTNRGHKAGIVYYDPVASRTGVILQAGDENGQKIRVVNIATGNFSITFAAAATSNVSSGTSTVIGQNQQMTFVWSVALGYWVAGLGTAVLSAAQVVYSNLDPSILQQATITVTNVQLKALRATPKTLVAAPGAGKLLELVSAVIKLNAGANVLSESTANLGIKYTNGSGVQVSQTAEMTGFIDQSVNTMTVALPVIDPITAYTASANQALVLHNLGAGEFGGNAAADATLTIDIQYRTHTI